eukprot:1160787-Pelagomonas_calceolata.AAC.12
MVDHAHPARPHGGVNCCLDVHMFLVASAKWMRRRRDCGSRSSSETPWRYELLFGCTHVPSGKCKVDETEKGWWITLIQRDPMEV